MTAVLAAAAGHGRLDTGHVAPAHIPAEVSRHAGTPDALPAGCPGKVGVLELAFDKIGGRTELTGHYQKTPLQIMRPLYIDPGRPDQAFVYLMATGGGIVQADRLRMDFRCGAQTAVHLTTQAATKVHRMDQDFATVQVFLNAEAGAFVEYLPDPVIMHEHSRLHQRTVITADPSATVLASETVYTGRLAHGEHQAFDVLAADFEVHRPDGSLVAVDTVRLAPPAGGVAGPAVLGDYGLFGGFFALTTDVPPDQLADTLHDALAAHPVTAGVSTLPERSGAWVRMLAHETTAMAAAQHALWDAARTLLTGQPAPDTRKT